VTSGPWRAAAAAAALLVGTVLAAAPVAAQRGPVRADAGRVPQAQRDPARRDTVRGPELVNWIPDDSVMLELLRRAGYRVVRYQAQTVGFDATTRTMTLATSDSTRAAVQRDSMLLVARRIEYNDSTKRIAARGDTIVMRDPSRGEDVIGLEEMTYDVERREGQTREFSTVANSGEDWRVMAHRAAFASDTSADRTTVWGRGGLITSCLDSVPHYHFLARELKRVSNSVIVARPAILYVQDVPVMWLPFIFQDIRTGRRSGIITPRVGFSEVVRNSPTYRRTIEDLGYYFAINDYVDAQVRMDWRSSARATDVDPGWTRVEGEFRYRWLDRFMSGGVAVSRHRLSTGNTNTGISWSHTQEFSSRTRFNTNINYVTSTTVQRQTTINPMLAMATIASQANLVRQQGPLAINIGGTQRQYPGREQVDRSFPSLNVASKPLTVGDWFVVTPTLALSNSEQLNLDAIGDFQWRYIQGPGGLDSVRLRRDSRTTTLTLGTPFKVFDFQVQADLRYNDVANDYPSIRTIPDPNDPTQSIDRVYARNFKSTADFTLGVGLPQLLKGTWNFAPTVSLSNVDPAGTFVRSERTNGAWVMQPKRLSYGAGVSPTFFALLPGFGSVERMRHSVSPTLSWGYSPRADVNPEFLEALGYRPEGYLGGLAQNRVSLALATNLEAKIRAPGDTSADGGRKVRVASLQFTSLSYDFELQRKTGRTGFATERFGYTFRSDLLPGFDLGVDYSLFQGSVLSDTAVFKPYRESVRFGFQLNRNSAVVRGVSRLFGVDAAPAAAPAPAASTDVMGGGLVSSANPNQMGLGSITGSRGRGAVQEIPSGQGFTASFSVSQQRQRPPVGGRVVTYDPRAECAALEGLPTYDFCLLQAERNRPTDLNGDQGTAGGTFYRVPPTTSVGVRTSFNLTPKWSASWNTTYDVERSEFASQVVTLQRELHDWRALFGFVRSPNGSFAFTFFVSLKAQPDIKFDYDRRSYRQPSGSLAR
jgi:hypothetical protein